jgi:hypothetical protein
MRERIQAESRSHLGSQVAASVAEHLGAATRDATAAPSGAVAAPAALLSSSAALLSELKSRNAFARAILLNEILLPPLSRRNRLSPPVSPS